LSGGDLVSSLLEIAVCAICLLAFAFIGARFIAKRHLQGPKGNKKGITGETA
jgi:uncharacterized protein YneF (UPF0154 family)